MTTFLQWLALATLLTIIAAPAFPYVRHGVKINPDPENAPFERWPH